jgi:hypothetical protein
MSGVFQNIDLPPPHRPASVEFTRPPFPPLLRGEDKLGWMDRGWGVNILEDAGHCSVLYIRKHFVSVSECKLLKKFTGIY